MNRVLAQLATVARLTDVDQVRRTHLIMVATGAMAVYLVGVSGVAVVEHNLALFSVALGAAGLASVAFALARLGRLAAAEWTTAGLIACGSIALIALHGPVSSRLGAINIGVVLLGLATRPWMALAQVALGVAFVRVAVAAQLPIPLSPSTTPIWLGVAQQVLFSTALMMMFTEGYRRLHATLGRRTAKLEAAHAELLAARDRLERLVGERTAELERASADLEAFSSAVAHDLQAPLRHIRHFLALFVDDSGLDEARLAPIRAVQGSAAELTSTVEAIVAANRQAAVLGK